MRSVSTQTLTQFNQTIQSMQVKFCQEQKDGWDQHLDTCTFGYNTSQHDSTKFTPFELMFRRKAFLPIEATMQNESPEEILEEFQTVPSLECKEGFLAKLIESRANILDKTKSNISAAQDKQKADYGLNPTVYKVGSKVLAKDFLWRKRKEGKLDYLWLGPYVIMKNLGNGMSSNHIECEKCLFIVSTIVDVHVSISNRNRS